MMECGHAANATDSKGNPTCVICIGFKAGATKVVATPNLEGRTAMCTYCKVQEPSSMALAFFEHRPERDKDSFYCGCRGFD
jgi:hypothetical protein